MVIALVANPRWVCKAALGNPVDPEVNSATAISDPRAVESVTISLPAINFSKRELGPRMSSGFKKILGERTFSACSTWADPAWWWIGPAIAPNRQHAR